MKKLIALALVTSGYAAQAGSRYVEVCRPRGELDDFATPTYIGSGVDGNKIDRLGELREKLPNGMSDKIEKLNPSATRDVVKNARAKQDFELSAKSCVASAAAKILPPELLRGEWAKDVRRYGLVVSAKYARGEQDCVVVATGGMAWDAQRKMEALQRDLMKEGRPTVSETLPPTTQPATQPTTQPTTQPATPVEHQGPPPRTQPGY